MKVISLPEIASKIRCRRSGKTFLSEFINQCKIEDAIIIPEGATNGDVFTTMFPDLEFTRGDCGIFACFMKMNNDVGFASLYETWWNAPYKGECNLSEKPTGSESEDKK